MCSAVLSGFKSRMGADQFDVQIVIADHVADLVQRARNEKYCEGGRKCGEAAGGQPGRNSDHVLFGDSHFKKALGMFCPKSVIPYDAH